MRIFPEEIFYKFKKENVEYSILRIKWRHQLLLQQKMLKPCEISDKYGFDPFLYQMLVQIDGKDVAIDDLLNLDSDVYLIIVETVMQMINSTNIN